MSLRSVLIVLLLLSTLDLCACVGSGRAVRHPSRLEVDRHTVVAERHIGRMPEAARQLLAMDLFLHRVLGVPAQRLRQPVTFVYVHRSKRMEKRLPFAGDRIGHMHLLPTDTRTWVLVREDTGLEDFRPAIVQVAELELARTGGEQPPWLRNGLYELLARVALVDGDLVMTPASFPTLARAGVTAAPLASAAQPDWSRYQEPQRWYTSALVVAWMLDEAPELLTRAIEDPSGFSLVDEVPQSVFDAWVERAVAASDTEPRTVIPDALDMEVPNAEPVTDAELDQVRVGLALSHPRGPKAFGLHKVDPIALDAATLELVEGPAGAACSALVGQDTAQAHHQLGLCLWRTADAAAEEHFRRAFRMDPGQQRAAIHAAALTLTTPGREADAASLLDDALGVVPADVDAHLMQAVIAARAGRCEEMDDMGDGPLGHPWSTPRAVTGPMEAGRDGFLREVLECGK